MDGFLADEVHGQDVTFCSIGKVLKVEVYLLLIPSQVIVYRAHFRRFACRKALDFEVFSYRSNGKVVRDLTSQVRNLFLQLNDGRFILARLLQKLRLVLFDPLLDITAEDAHRVCLLDSLLELFVDSVVLTLIKASRQDPIGRLAATSDFLEELELCIWHRIIFLDELFGRQVLMEGDLSDFFLLFGLWLGSVHFHIVEAQVGKASLD